MRLLRMFYCGTTAICVSALCAVMLLPITNALADFPDAWQTPAADTITWFETSGEGYGSLTPDFDCQGLSAGVFQWNVGKKSLWNELLKDVPELTFVETMPTYGRAFRDALAAPASIGLEYVTQFQSYANRSSCDGDVRRARWNNQGLSFAREISNLLQSDKVIGLQRKALVAKLREGWNYATWWAEAKRGKGATPTYVEFLVFSDTLNFNGKWTQESNYGKVQDLRRARTDREVFSEIVSYLSAAPVGQYQRREARENAKLWNVASVDSDKLDLLCFSYLVAKNIRRSSAIPFRLNTLSRRGTIIFNDGWVNGERKRFRLPAT